MWQDSRDANKTDNKAYNKLLNVLLGDELSRLFLEKHRFEKEGKTHWKRNGDLSYVKVAILTQFWITDKVQFLKGVEVGQATHCLFFPCAPKPPGEFTGAGYPKRQNKIALGGIPMVSFGGVRPWRLLRVNNSFCDRDLTEVTGDIRSLLQAKTVEDAVFVSVADMATLIRAQKSDALACAEDQPHPFTC